MHVVTKDGEDPLVPVDSLEKMSLTGDRIIVLDKGKAVIQRRKWIPRRKSRRNEKYKGRIT